MHLRDQIKACQNRINKRLSHAVNVNDSVVNINDNRWLYNIFNTHRLDRISFNIHFELGIELFSPFMPLVQLDSFTSL